MTEKATSKSGGLVTATENSTASSQAWAASAGRHLDARVMAAVFKREIKWWRGEPSYIGTDTSLGDAPGVWVTSSTVPHFSTSIYDAFLILKEMKGGWKSVKYEASSPFTVTVWPNQKADNHTAAADTMPLAICLAALKAVGA